MPTIILVRHAKAEPQGKKQDFERSLTQEGRVQAWELYERFQAAGLLPDFGIYSSAIRSRQTLNLLVGDKVPMDEVPQLFVMPGLGDLQRAEEIIKEAGEETPFSRWMELDRGGIFLRYGIDTARSIHTTIERQQAQTTLIVGHALTINALAFALHRGGHPLSMGRCPEYAHGFVITEKKVTTI